MAVTIDLAGLLTTIDDCEAAPSGWTGITWTQYSGFNREGTYCYGAAASNTTISGYKTVTAFSMSAAAVYVWMFCGGNMDTTANGGLGIVLGDGTNRRAYYVGGREKSRFQVGVWNCFMVHGANPPTQYNQELGTAAPDFGAITQVGVRFKTLSKALGGADNCFIDIMRRGTGIRIKGGTSGDQGTFAQIAADDASTAAGKAYGILREVQTGVYEVQGQLLFGDNGSGDSYFKDTDAVVVYAANGAGSGLYTFKTIGGTGTNSFIAGVKVGSGDTAVGRNGITIMSAGPQVVVDFNNTAMNTCNIYGSKFFKLSTIALPSTVTKEFIGNTVDQCGVVTANQCIIRGNVFSGYTPNTNAAVKWNNTINIKNCRFVANTHDTDNPHAIEHPNQGAYDYIGMQFFGNDYDIYYTAPASSGVLTINADPNSNPGTYEILNPTGNSVSIINTKPITIYCVDKLNQPVGNVSCAIYKTSDNTELLNEDSDPSTGIATESFNYPGQDVDIYWRVRESPAAGNRYKPQSGVGKIKTDGFSVTVIMEPEPLA